MTPSLALRARARVSENADVDAPFWRTTGLFRPAATDKQRRQFEKNIGWDPREDLIGVRCTRNPDGFYIPEGIVMDTKRYLEALWSRCVSLTGETASGSTIALHQTRVNSLQDLRGYDATVIAAGAAVQSIAELRGAAFAGTLDLCQGYTVELVKEAEEGGEHQTHNSMLGQPYVAFQNKYKAVIGATQRHGVTFHEAFQILEHSLDDTSPEADAASDSLVRAARELVPALADGWRVARVRSGVRAIPSRTHLGSIPYAGRLMGEWDNCWIIAGLGARGLVYHALLGELTAGAVLGGLGNDEAFEGYRELLRWMDNTKTVR